MSKAKKKNITKFKPGAKPAERTASDKRVPFLILAGILVTVFLALLPVLKSELLNYDDDIYITNNPYIQQLNAANTKQLFSDYYYNQYSPVAMTLMALQVKVFGNKAGSLKLISLLLHMANTLLVFFFIRQAFGRNDYAIITAVLFGIHPMQVESVAWLAASMKIGTYAFFFLASLLAYLQYLKKDNWAYYFGALALFLLSCFSKEQAIALTATLFALDYLKGRALLSRRVLLEKIPFLILSLLFAYVTLSVKGEMQSEQMAGYYSAFDRIVFSSYAFSSYWVKLLIPSGLSFFYTYPLKTEIPWHYYVTPVFAGFVLYALYYAWKHEKRVIAFGILFFLINIFLTILSQVMSVRDIIMADRFVYLPSIGFFLLLAWGLVKLIQHNQSLSKAVWGGLAIYGLVLALVSFQRSRLWENTSTILSDAIEKGSLEKGKINPFLALAYNNRGIDRKNKGDIQGALADYNQAIAANSSYASSYLNRANILFNAGQYAEAIPDYNKSIELNPRQAIAFSNRGGAYAGLQQYEPALRDLTKAIELDPNFTDALKNRSIVLYNTNQFAEALADLDRFLKLIPDDADIINFKALTLQQLNRMGEAEIEFTRSIQLNPQQGIFYLNRSIMYNNTGRKALALEDAKRAQSLGATVSPEYLESLK